MCKLLTFPRVYQQDSASSFYSLAATFKPKFVFRFFDGITNAPFCDSNQLSLGTITKNAYSKKKTEYGVFSTSPLTVDSKQDFLISFKLSLKENIIASQNILGVNPSDNVLNNLNVDAVPELDQEFQPLLTFGNSASKDLMEIRCDASIVNKRPLIFGTLGLVYKGTDLYLQFLSVDTTSNNYCLSPEQGKITSETITASGVVTIEFYRENEQLFFKLNGIVLNTTSIGTPTINTVNTGTGNSFNIGMIHRSFYETRFLYSDLCNFYSEIENQLTFYTDFNNAIEFSPTIVSFNSTINTNKLFFYNYLISYVIEDLLNLCCPLETSFIFSDSALGCCFTPSEEDNRKYKLEKWKQNSVLENSITNLSMMNRIGDNDSKEKLLKKITFLNSVLLYLQTIRDRIICDGKTYRDYISDETIELIINSFIPYGINIKCAFEIMDIGKFTNCCGDLGPVIDCNCTDELPSAIISADPHTYDRASEADETISYTSAIPYEPTGKVSYSCCTGDKTIEVVELVNPNKLPIELISPSTTVNGEFSYSINYLYLNSKETNSLEFYVKMLICGKEVLRKHLYKCIDTCEDQDSSVPVVSSTVSLIINSSNHTYNYEEVSQTISLGDYDCCNENQFFEILDVDPSNVSPNSGLTITGPIKGEKGQGNLTYSYIFDGSKAIDLTVQRLFIKYILCGKFVHTTYIDFDIQVDCTPVVPVFTPTNPALNIDLANLSSGNYFSDPIEIDYECCLRQNEFRVSLIANGLNLFNELKSKYGIEIVFPTAVKQPISGNSFQIEYKFDRNIWIANRTTQVGALPRNLQFEIGYDYCGNNSNLTKIIDLEIDDTCTESLTSVVSNSIQVNLYNPVSRPVVVNSEFTVSVATCNSTDGKMIYGGVKAIGNNAKLADISYPGTPYETPINISFTIDTYSINVGNYTSGSYPANQSSDINVNFPNTITPQPHLHPITAIIKDNYMRSAGAGNVSLVFPKSNTISYNPNKNRNICFLVHLNNTKLSVPQVSYNDITVAGDFRIRMYDLGILPSITGQLLNDITGSVAKILDCTFIGTIIESGVLSIPTTTGSAGAMAITPNSVHTGFFWVEMVHDSVLEANAVTGLIDVQFDIIT